MLPPAGAETMSQATGDTVTVRSDELASAETPPDDEFPLQQTQKTENKRQNPADRMQNFLEERLGICSSFSHVVYFMKPEMIVCLWISKFSTVTPWRIPDDIGCNYISVGYGNRGLGRNQTEPPTGIIFSSHMVHDCALFGEYHEIKFS